MKKVIIITCGIILAGILAYLGGYFYYLSMVPQNEKLESVAIERIIPASEEDLELTYGYLVKIEQEMLVIYKMPENIIYDSVKLSSLQLEEKDYITLRKGIEFYDLTEVFEFLENSMS